MLIMQSSMCMVLIDGALLKIWLDYNTLINTPQFTSRSRCDTATCSAVT